MADTKAGALISVDRMTSVNNKNWRAVQESNYGARHLSGARHIRAAWRQAIIAGSRKIFRQLRDAGRDAALKNAGRIFKLREAQIFLGLVTVFIECRADIAHYPIDNNRIRHSGASRNPAYY